MSIDPKAFLSKFYLSVSMPTELSKVSSTTSEAKLLSQLATSFILDKFQEKTLFLNKLHTDPYIISKNFRRFLLANSAKNVLQTSIYPSIPAQSSPWTVTALRLVALIVSAGAVAYFMHKENAPLSDSFINASNKDICLKNENTSQSQHFRHFKEIPLPFTAAETTQIFPLRDRQIREPSSIFFNQSWALKQKQEWNSAFPTLIDQPTEAIQQLMSKNMAFLEEDIKKQPTCFTFQQKEQLASATSEMHLQGCPQLTTLDICPAPRDTQALVALNIRPSLVCSNEELRSFTFPSNAAHQTTTTAQNTNAYVYAALTAFGTLGAAALCVLPKLQSLFKAAAENNPADSSSESDTEESDQEGDPLKKVNTREKDDNTIENQEKESFKPSPPNQPVPSDSDKQPHIRPTKPNNKPKPKRDRRNKKVPRTESPIPPFESQKQNSKEEAYTVSKDPLWYQPESIKEQLLNKKLNRFQKQIQNGDFTSLQPDEKGIISLCSIYNDIQGRQLDKVKKIISKIPNSFLDPLFNQALLIKNVYIRGEVCRALIAKMGKEQIREKDSQNKTFLHKAVIHEAEPSLLEILINKGTELDAVDETGRTAIYYAAELKKNKCFELLHQRGANLQLYPNGFPSIDELTKAHQNLSLFNYLALHPVQREALSEDSLSQDSQTGSPANEVNERNSFNLTLEDSDFENSFQDSFDEYKSAVDHKDGILLAKLINDGKPTNMMEDYVQKAVERMNSLKDYLKRTYRDTRSCEGDFHNFLNERAYQWAVDRGDKALLAMLISENILYKDKDPHVLAAIEEIKDATSMLATYLESDTPFISMGQLQQEKNPLHDALYNQNKDLFNLLVAAGANLSQTDNNGNSALMVACETGNLEACNFLLHAGLSLTKPNNEDKTPLDALINLIERETPATLIGEIKTFLKEQSKLPNELGYTLLHYAVENKHTKLIETLINCGADILITDKMGHPLLIFGIMRDVNAEILELLMTQESVNQPDKAGRLPLHYAIDRGLMLTQLKKDTDCLQVIELLLKNGAYPKAVVEVSDTRREKGIYSLPYYKDIQLPMLPKNTKSPFDYIQKECELCTARFLKCLKSKDTNLKEEVANSLACIVLVEEALKKLKHILWKKEEFNEEELDIFELVKDEIFIQDNKLSFGKFLCGTPFLYALENNNKELIQKLINAKIPIQGSSLLIHLLRLTEISIPKASKKVWTNLAHLAQVNRWNNLNFTLEERKIFNYLLEQKLVKSKEKAFARFLCEDPYGDALKWNKKLLISLLLQAQVIHNSPDNEENKKVLEAIKKVENTKVADSIELKDEDSEESTDLEENMIDDLLLSLNEFHHEATSIVEDNDSSCPQSSNESESSSSSS